MGINVVTSFITEIDSSFVGWWRRFGTAVVWNYGMFMHDVFKNHKHLLGTSTSSRGSVVAKDEEDTKIPRPANLQSTNNKKRNRLKVLCTFF